MVRERLGGGGGDDAHTNRDIGENGWAKGVPTAPLLLAG
ncbi:conserved hypothetical protein [Ahrensia sp. R2A130]|nr:conserved hypothetical protein [Ahrensia sp. R2A130]